MSEVKRFKFINGVGNWSHEEAVLVSDHDRIVAELKAQLEHSETKVGWLLRDNEKNVSERDAVIAKQAKVIEKLKKDIDDFIIYVDSDADSFGDRYWPTRNKLIAMLKETTAVERGEA